MTYEELLKEKQEFKERLKHCSNTMIYHDTLKHYNKVCEKVAKLEKNMKTFRLYYTLESEFKLNKYYIDRKFESKQDADNYGMQYLNGAFMNYSELTKSEYADIIEYVGCEERK